MFNLTSEDVGAILKVLAGVGTLAGSLHWYSEFREKKNSARRKREDDSEAKRLASIEKDRLEIAEDKEKLYTDACEERDKYRKENIRLQTAIDKFQALKDDWYNEREEFKITRSKLNSDLRHALVETEQLRQSIKDLEMLQNDAEE